MVSAEFASLSGANVYIDRGLAATDWEAKESARLRTMDEFLGAVTHGDLVPVVEGVQAIHPGEGVTLLDIGAGTGTTTEELCREHGVDYSAFDAKKEFLDGRATIDSSHKLLGRSEDMTEIPDAAFNITYSRAATAWSSDPDRTIAEQLRVTGDTAVFTEYDWSRAHVHSESNDVTAAGMAAKLAIMSVLEAAHFDTLLGAELQDRIDRVASAAGYIIEHVHVRHELPEADHRELFANVANTIVAQLRAASGNTANAVGAAKAATAASILTKYLGIITRASSDSVTFRLPALSTEVVRIIERQQRPLRLR